MMHKGLFKTLFIMVTIMTLLLTFSCGGGGETGEKGGSEPVREKGLKLLLSGVKPELFGVLEKVKFGMTEEEAQKAAPEIANATDMWGYQPEGCKGVFFGEFYSDQRCLTIVNYHVYLPTGSADTLKSTWGEPIPVTVKEKASLMWLNPEKGIRAILEDYLATGKDANLSLNLQRYMPLEAFLGEDKVQFGFEKKQPLLGATVEQLKAAYGSFVDISKVDKSGVSILYLCLPADQYSSDKVNALEVTLDKGKVYQFKMWLDSNLDKSKLPEIKKLLDKKFGGTPKESKAYGGKELLYSEKPKIEFKEQGDKYLVSVSLE